MEYDSIEGLPEEFEGAWLTDEELIARNKILEPLGKKICRKHQGVALPLSKFYKNSGRKSYHRDCIDCDKDTRLKQYTEKYRTDKRFRDEEKKKIKERYAKDPEPFKQRNNNHYNGKKKEGLLRSFGRLLS